MPSPIRYALVTGADSAEALERYLPGNYYVLARANARGEACACVIAGRDSAGWTLDGYVIPRLASGLVFAKEINHAGDIERD